MLVHLERQDKFARLIQNAKGELFYRLSGNPYRGFPFPELEEIGSDRPVNLKDVMENRTIRVRKADGSNIYAPRTGPETEITIKEEGKQVDKTNPKDLIGVTKPPVSAIPPVAILNLGKTMQDGKEKYGHMNWRETNVRSDVYYNAMMRHLLQWFDGEDRAEDSGCHHLAHVMACCSIILDAEASGSLIDDRPTSSKVASRYIKENTKT